MASEKSPSRSPPRCVGGVVILVLLLPNFPLGVAANDPQLTVTTNSTGSTFTWEADVSGSSLDPHVATCFFYIDCTIAQNVYENLLWYNGTTWDKVIPWLAKEYTPSPDGGSIQFTLRDGIRFADDNPLNSTAVYFSLNRFVLEGWGGGFLCCDFQNNYTANWVDRLLAQNLVEVTGPLTFKLNVLHPDGGLKYALAAPGPTIVDPQFVMKHDLALWEGPNSTIFLPYPTLHGSMMEQTSQYLKDEAYACSKTDTTLGCRISYLGISTDGSLAGTGPYMITSASADLTRVVLSARSNYWGGPNQFSGGQKIVPQFETVNTHQVSVESDRIQDLQNAAARGEAMSVVVNNDQLYLLANRTVWQTKEILQSNIQNVSLYGPYRIAGDTRATISFVMNVSDASTGQFQQFQPFADRRLRLAFADAVDIGVINRDYNNKMGQIAKNFISPDSVPPGAYNDTIVPYYTFSLKEVQTLLIAAMKSPLTSFRFFDGTLAPRGLFNNTYGCPVLNAQNKCDNPIPRTVTLAYFTETGGADINNEVIRKMAIAINNVSETYRMGLHVAIEALPYDLMQHLGFGGNLYAFEYFQGGGTPWVGTAFDGAPLGPSRGFCNTDLPSCLNPSDDGWNSTRKNQLYAAFQTASSENNVSAVVSLSNQLMELENMAVTHVWTIYPYFFVPVTSNVQGFNYNPYIDGMYFASLAPANTSAVVTSAGGLLTNIPLLASVVVAVAVVALAGTFVMRRRNDSHLSIGDRKLAAIMFTDIVGYTALTQKNERLALELLAEHNRTLRPMFPRFGGREVKSIGDSFLVEFSSALEAVQCAVAIQENLHHSNQGVQADRIVQLRIGVHIGDVITREGDIVGDAVNISSRIEPLAPPGGVCISQQVYDQVRNKIELQLVKLENAPLKNVSVPVVVYSVIMPWNTGQT